MIRVDSRMCRVDFGEEEQECRVRGLLFREERRCTRPIAVGDRVVVEERSTPPAVVIQRLERRNELSRPHIERNREQVIASNLDQAVIVSACDGPGLNPRLIDRILVTCGHEGFDGLLVFNKEDLLENPAEELEPLLEIYRPLGYEILLTSALTGTGIEELRERLGGKISVFAGMSGVGKSALLTAIQPDLALVSNEVSAATGKGRHTTTRVNLLKLQDGGYVVDTPGVREFGISELEPYEISHFFIDFQEFVGGCRFRNCSHTHEERCAVKEAVEEDLIHPYRYDSYLRIIGSMEEEFD